MIRRKKPMKQGGRLKTRKRVNPVNRERKDANWKRAYHSVARVKFVERLPCAACGDTEPPERDNAHTKNDGASRKGHYTTIIPLCHRCHGRQHGPNGGWMAIGMTAEGRERAAAQTEALWQARGQPRADERDGGGMYVEGD